MHMKTYKLVDQLIDLLCFFPYILCDRKNQTKKLFTTTVLKSHILRVYLYKGPIYPLIFHWYFNCH